ncbi:MAG: hypothetical protein V4662_25070 [Verrucomicrobiota bacterium]
MSRPDRLPRPDLCDLRQGTDYLASLQDQEAWDALKAEIEAAKARRAALTKNAA